MSLFGQSFQPSEFAKIGFILFYAAFLNKLKQEGRIKKYTEGFLWPIFAFIPIAFTIFYLQNHFSATFIIGLVLIVQMIIAGVKMKHLVLSAAAVIPVGIIFFMKMGGFRMTRIQTWLNPFADPSDEGWQITQSLYAIASGGLFGVGLGNSNQKYLYLPEAHNDFIFAILAEEWGFIGCLAVIVLFGVFIWRGILIAMRAKSNFASLVAIGITALIGMEAIINIAVVSNTIPVTGMPLPFFSYGGSALITNLAAVGILLNISKTARKV